MIARVFALGLLAAGATGIAQAQAYVRGGVTLTDAEPYDAAAGFELAGGYDFGAWRAELSIDSNQFDFSQNAFPRFQGTDGRVTSAFALAYVDIPTQSAFTPYVGAGIGFSNLDAPTLRGEIGSPGGPIVITRDGYDVTEFVVQGALGVSFAMTQNTLIDASVRYATYPDKQYYLSTNGELNADKATQARLSLRYNF